jgi:hypothetical protein
VDRKSAIDDRVVQAMLVQLKNEERVDGKATRTIGRVASVVTFLLGAAMLVTGLVMAGQSAGKSVAVIGSLVLSVFGLCFIGMALWVWITTSRSKGR